VAGKPSFETIFKLTGFHLGAVAAGFILAATLFAPKPRAVTPLPERTIRVLELKNAARAAASSSPGAAPNHAVDLGQALAWPACDPDSERAMGKQP
jgi:hypothetical protein